MSRICFLRGERRSPLIGSQDGLVTGEAAGAGEVFGLQGDQLVEGGLVSPAILHGGGREVVGSAAWKTMVGETVR